MARVIPNRPQELTRALLHDLVGELHPGVAVEGFDLVKVRNYGEADNAQSVSTSTQITLDLRYNRDAPGGLPRRALAKMSIPADVECANPELAPLFENEVNFYKRLRAELEGVETPQGLGGHFEPGSGRFILLMEDLSARGAHFNTTLDDDDIAIAESVLDGLARLHARYWESPRFAGDLSWVQGQVSGSMEDMFDRSIKAHVENELAREKFKREFVQEAGTTPDELYALTKALKRHQASLPQTFLHGDAHFGNTYVLPGGQSGLIDWQVCARGFLMHDVGYFIMTCCSVDMRRKQERDLLAYYRDRLGAHGIKDAPGIDELWDEYRLTPVQGFYLGWLTAPRENYGLEVCVMGNHRTKAAYLDHDSGNRMKKLL